MHTVHDVTTLTGMYMYIISKERYIALKTEVVLIHAGTYTMLYTE